MVSLKSGRWDTELLRTIKYKKLMFYSWDAPLHWLFFPLLNYSFDFIAVCWNHSLHQVAPDTVQLTVPTFPSLMRSSARPGIAHPYPQRESSSLQAFLVVEQPRAVHDLYPSRRWVRREVWGSLRWGLQLGEIPTSGSHQHWCCILARFIWHVGWRYWRKAIVLWGKNVKHMGSRREELTGEKEEQSPSSPLPVNCELSGF